MEDVESHHDFFDKRYVERWAEDAMKKRPERRAFFDAFVAEIENSTSHIAVELGVGPGLLAEQLLQRTAVGEYYALDYSPQMLSLCRQRLAPFTGRVHFVEADFKNSYWRGAIRVSADLVVTQQAVHELRHARHIPALYGEVYRLLKRDGLFLMCDLMNDKDTDRAHYLREEQHIDTLRDVGFAEIRPVLRSRGLGLIAAVKTK